ncbi:MAG: hypothetical protein IJF67_00145 [Clostridia bacterium]|nr:hypothetical protein [Clostridia bacterium]
MAKFERQLNARASELVRWVDESVIGGMQAELIDSSVQRVSGMRICLWCLQSTRGTASLQIIAGDNGAAAVTAISADTAFVDGVEALLEEFQPMK